MSILLVHEWRSKARRETITNNPTYPKESHHYGQVAPLVNAPPNAFVSRVPTRPTSRPHASRRCPLGGRPLPARPRPGDRKSTRLNSSHDQISYAVFCLKKKKNKFVSLCLQKKKKMKAST